MLALLYFTKIPARWRFFLRAVMWIDTIPITRLVFWKSIQQLTTVVFAMPLSVIVMVL